MASRRAEEPGRSESLETAIDYRGGFGRRAGGEFVKKGLRILDSAIDQSVNFVEQQLIGFLESRFVRKCPDYFIAYLSSQTGCNRGCTFCHLTATGQTEFTDSTHGDFQGQALEVFKHYRRSVSAGAPEAKWMHYNFMARGEPLANQILLDSSNALLMKLAELSQDVGLPAKFNVSTIMPLTLKKPLAQIFSILTPTIYYSLYSTNQAFRAKWMPAAMPVRAALGMLREYQDFSKKIVKIHFPFIEGVNDSVNDVLSMCEEIDRAGLLCEFNLVRYNPANDSQGRESAENVIEDRMGMIRRHFVGKVQIIPRVGYDVSASCGMFVNDGKEGGE